MLRLFTDTDCDITPEIAKKYGYELISMPYIIDGVTYYPFKEEESFDYKAFYNLLRKGTIPTTAALSPMEYINYFEPVFAKGDDILYVHFSRAMSGTFNSMHLALEELKEKYPKRKFYEIDTLGITICAYAAVIKIGEMYKAKEPLEEIMEYADKEIQKNATYFYADDLKFFAKSGRVSGFAAFMGGIIGLHPIINMNSDGIMGSVDKARGKKKTLDKIVDYMRKLEDNIKDHVIVIGHSDALETVEELKQMIIKEFGEGLKFDVHYVNPTAGSHCGPDNVGVTFHAIHR